MVRIDFMTGERLDSPVCHCDKCGSGIYAGDRFFRTFDHENVCEECTEEVVSEGFQAFPFSNAFSCESCSSDEGDIVYFVDGAWYCETCARAYIMENVLEEMEA